MIEYHKTASGKLIAELADDVLKIHEVGDILDLIAEIGQNDCSDLIIHDSAINKDFFDLKTGFAGEILQKFSNYRVRLAITGDFSKYPGKSLKDFVRECNRGNLIFFVPSVGKAFDRLG
jgi:hypothetical protein